MAVENGDTNNHENHAEQEKSSAPMNRDQQNSSESNGDEKTEKVAFSKLFSFADKTDVILMIVGTIGAIGNGSCMPLMTILFGQMIDSFGSNQNTDVVSVVSKVSLRFVYLAVGAAVAAFLQVSCWMVTGERQAARIRALNNSGLSLATIEPLNGSNFKKWRETVELYLGLQGIDWCLTESEPVIDDFSSAEDMAKQKEWVRANRMTRLILKNLMTDVVRGSIAEKDIASEYMESIAQKFKENEKAEISQLLDKLMGLKFNPAEGVREHIMRLIEITSSLSDLNMPFPADFVVHHALRTLPTNFNQLKTTYFAQKDKWDLNELIAICVQEEDRIKRDSEIVVNLVTKPKFKSGKGKFAAANGASSGEGTSGTKTLGPKKPWNKKAKKTGTFKCFFCKREGHMKKNCQGFKDWLVKKGLSKQEGSKEK